MKPTSNGKILNKTFKLKKMNIDELRKLFQQHNTKENDMNLLLHELREAGASQMQCTKILVLELKTPVLLSKV